MKRILASLFLVHVALLASANPFLGRWDCVGIDKSRLRMTFRQDMKVRIEERKSEETEVVAYEVSPENPRITINGTMFYYLFTDDDHFVLYPDMSEFIPENSDTRTVRNLLLSMFLSHYLFTGRRAP